MMPSRSRHRRPKISQSTWMLLLLGAAALALGAKGIWSEETVSLFGDMPRHMMNGVFLLDLLQDGHRLGVTPYSQLYFAHYPALSLGHHPLLLPIAEVPFFALLGLSVLSARTCLLVFYLIAVVAWFLLVRLTFDAETAFLSSLLFLSSPIVVYYSRIVMTEIPALSLLLLATLFMECYLRSARRSHLALFVLSFVAACYTRQLVIFALPVLGLHLARKVGLRRLFSIERLLAFGIMGVLLLPQLYITLRLSPTNVAFAAQGALDPNVLAWGERLRRALVPIWTTQLTVPVPLLAIAGLVAAYRRRHESALLHLGWIVVLGLLAVFVRLNSGRITMYWVPAFCLFAVLSRDLFGSARLRRGASALLVLLAVYQVVAAARIAPDRAGGYEEAARYVLDHPRGATVMYSATVDTGYFIFFVRKHDPERRQVVLRADKVLATSSLSWFEEEKISERSEIYQVLADLGTCYVVVEDTESPSRALNWLREEVGTERFELRHEVEIESEDSRLRGVSLGIYERVDCGEPSPDAVLEMSIPLAGTDLKLRLQDVRGWRPPPNARERGELPF